MKMRLRMQLGRVAGIAGLGFAIRLAIAVVVTFAVVGAAGYIVIVDQLRDNYVARQVAT
jgi:hypothetical protein